MARTGVVWLFDLDNTLHDASREVFRLIDESMTDYIARELQVDRAQADFLRRDYWRRYGATMLGLQRHHGISPVHFLARTHVLPGLEGALHTHAHDRAALRRLRGRKLVLTNAPAAYAWRVLSALGLAQHFEDVISIEDMRMFHRLKVPPSRCILVEDTLAHQKAARRLGMRTVWMQRYVRHRAHGPEVGVYLRRKPAYVCARIGSLQKLRTL
jgi:putative hydrolase of the HAD superfamily